MPVTIVNTTGLQLVVRLGNTATLTAELITGSEPVTYQWMKRDAVSGAFSAIPGATDLTLTLFNTTAADSGQYWIVGTNALGSVSSAQTNVIIASLLEVQNTSGDNVRVSPGAPLVLTAQLIAGTQPVSYQWMKRDALGLELPVPGATGLTLTIAAALPTDSGRYWIVATNADGYDESTGTQVQVARSSE